jgi:hypothetical protein
MQENVKEDDKKIMSEITKLIGLVLLLLLPVVLLALLYYHTYLKFYEVIINTNLNTVITIKLFLKLIGVLYYIISVIYFIVAIKRVFYQVITERGFIDEDNSWGDTLFISVLSQIVAVFLL